MWVHVRPQDGGALLCVDDAGSGVPKELQETVFEAFRQANASTTRLTDEIAHLPNVRSVESLIVPNVIPLGPDGAPDPRFNSTDQLASLSSVQKGHQQRHLKR